MLRYLHCKTSTEGGAASSLHPVGNRNMSLFIAYNDCTIDNIGSKFCTLKRFRVKMASRMRGKKKQ
jgi:hypothetical protein